MEFSPYLPLIKRGKEYLVLKFHVDLIFPAAANAQ